ncbi:hypothetical protein ABZ783_35235, partial [Micromonospora sp. NPDC047738]|uniref:hypothetical protein n=1 Tax=Micromonospora sp. NPDC047738 TaxID=3155741 RepID=UPI003401784F
MDDHEHNQVASAGSMMRGVVDGADGGRPERGEMEGSHGGRAVQAGLADESRNELPVETSRRRLSEGRAGGFEKLPAPVLHVDRQLLGPEGLRWGMAKTFGCTCWHDCWIDRVER